MVSKNKLIDVANVLRRDVALMTTEAGSGHPSSCFSCAELMSALFFEEMHYDTKNANNPDNDEFILSKGHAAPILYSALFRAKAIKGNLNSLRDLTSKFQGHPMPSSLSWAKTATGSLGQGLSMGVGIALAAKLQNRKYRTYVLLGDSELAEGSNWEAFQLASHYKLHNLCVILDVNRLGQRGETMLGHDIKTYKKRISSFGWNAILINGHNIHQIRRAFNRARMNNKPTAIIAHTFKGKGVSFMENKEGWHGKAMDHRHLTQALNELPNVNMPNITIRKPKKIIPKKSVNKSFKFPTFNDFEATRKAYGKTLAKLAISNSKIIVVDGEVSNSTYSNEVKKLTKNQFLEMYIAEQNMIGVALGLSVKNFKVYASTFAAFTTRAHDQIRMSALSNANFTISGSHAGVSIGEDGASQMGLGDIAMFRNIVNSNILYPSDAVSCSKLVKLSENLKNITYIRTTRSDTPILYKNNEKFPLGDFKVLKKSRKDKAVLIGAGITTHESLEAYRKLKVNNKNVAVVDLYSIKPLNITKLAKFIKTHGNKIIVTEDHFQEGGIGEMLASELKNQKITIKLLNIKEIPHSGTQEELLKKYKIDSNAIIKEFKKL